jgi:hypothetical protein
VSLTLENFVPLPGQMEIIRDVRQNFNYDEGVHEILLSGSVGSSKSEVMAHLVVTHCILYPRAVVCLARQAMPDLKDTILKKVLNQISCLEEGKQYEYNRSKPSILFGNGSEIICRSWHDQRYERARSLELSMLCIEELTENSSEEFKLFYPEYRSRVGRLTHVKENLVICATNPAGPSHEAYQHFIVTKNKCRHVYYSVTTDNPYLPAHYKDQLLELYDERQALRYIYGKWVDIAEENIYYAFDEKLSVVDNIEMNPLYPVIISYDFNIGLNKPISAAVHQYINGNFLFFDEIVIHGADTASTIEEGIGRGIIGPKVVYVIRGDATGRARSTKSIKSDYEIIEKCLSNAGVKFRIDVPLSNPPLRTRHNVVNGQLKNAKGNTHIFISRKCKNIIKGLKQAKLKKGSTYLEDDSDPTQHITTSLGYSICRQINNNEKSTKVNIT